jgi:hypothetical protein
MKMDADTDKDNLPTEMDVDMSEKWTFLCLKNQQIISEVISFPTDNLHGLQP